MTTAAQTTLMHAAELLETQAVWLRNCIFSWKFNTEVKDYHDDVLCTALELRLLAKRIDDGQIAVPQAPTFERTRNGNNLDTKKHVHER